MKEYPILYSTPMVLSILKDLKDKTRRKVSGLALKWLNEGFTPEFVADTENDLCPYGKVGDKLWVRETWKPLGFVGEDDMEFVIEYKADGVVRSNYFDEYEREQKLADMIDRECTKKGIKINGDGSWIDNVCPLSFRPGIHMWKEFARIWLEITEIRVERLDDITEADILSEGVRYPVNNGRPCFRLGVENSALSFMPKEFMLDGKGIKSTEEMLLKAHWAELWCNINGRESYDANPWVWVISFKVLSTTGKPE